jgi:hypothetical protein
MKTPLHFLEQRISKIKIGGQKVDLTKIKCSTSVKISTRDPWLSPVLLKYNKPKIEKTLDNNAD